MTRTARNLAILIAYTLIAVGFLMGPDQAHGENPDPGTVADCVVDVNGDYLCENPDDVAIDTPVDVTCTEDMSCWDCEVMGNGLCGCPEILPGGVDDGGVVPEVSDPGVASEAQQTTNSASDVTVVDVQEAVARGVRFPTTNGAQATLGGQNGSVLVGGDAVLLHPLVLPMPLLATVDAPGAQAGAIGPSPELIVGQGSAALRASLHSCGVYPTPLPTDDYPTPSPDYPAPARPTPIEPAFTG